MSISSIAGKRISILLPDLRPGGAERLHVNLCREWLRRGIEVEFVVRKLRGALLDELPMGATVVDMSASRVRDLIWPLARYLRKTRPDVLLTAMWPSTIIAPLAARLARYKGRVVASEHSPLSLAYAGRGPVHRRIMKLSQQFGYPLSDARIAVSQGVAVDLAMLSGMSIEYFDVVHNPASVGGRGRQSNPIPELSSRLGPVILTVGTLKSVKRHDLLINAFAKVAAEGTAVLWIVGEGPERGALEGQISNLGLAGRVLLAGYSSDPGRWYAQADLFVLSSDYEGFGNVLVEALEYGLPIVSTDCVAGPAEILESGRYGRLTPVGDADALAQAMSAALQDPVDREALMARARDFAVDVIADRYLDILLPGWRAGGRT